MRAEKNIIILAIETSCDETAASVLSVNTDGQWPKIIALSSVIKSQIKLHSKMGGVVPESAARAHVKYIRPVVKKALAASLCSLNAINYIAVTVGPGLLPSLMIGVEFAKAMSFATGIPIIPVNHMAGHLYSPFGRINSKFKYRNPKQNLNSKIKDSKLLFPMISLIVSGGHTILVLMKDLKNYQVLGQTLDDAAGEAFDKVAKMLKLPYPGGPEISKLARKGNSKAIMFPRPMLTQKNYNFSFSGLKTAVLYYLRDNPQTANSNLPGRQAGKLKANVCASFQQAVVDVLAAKTLRAAREYQAKSISLSGGVAANQHLRHELQAISRNLGVKFFVPQKNLCTDNAEMIALAAGFMLKNGFKPKNFRAIKANSNLQL